MIRISEYARLTGLSAMAVRNRIEAETLAMEEIGGVQHVPYPKKSEIKFQKV